MNLAMMDGWNGFLMYHDLGCILDVQIPIFLFRIAGIGIRRMIPRYSGINPSIQ
jgi:hypothetical protein